MQRAICCRIFTPAARSEYPAASLRDYCCGVLTILAGLILQAYGIHKAYIYIGLLVMVYAVLAILAIIATPETKDVNLEV
jgi:hypothetical protein